MKKNYIHPGPWDIEKMGRKYIAKNLSDGSREGPFRTKQDAAEFCNEENGALADAGCEFARDIRRAEERWEPS